MSGGSPSPMGLLHMWSWCVFVSGRSSCTWSQEDLLYPLHGLLHMWSCCVLVSGRSSCPWSEEDLLYPRVCYICGLVVFWFLGGSLAWSQEDVIYIFLAGLRLEVCMWAALAGTTMARGRSTVNLSRMARWLRGSFGQVPTVLAGAPIEEVCPSFFV